MLKSGGCFRLDLKSSQLNFAGVTTGENYLQRPPYASVADPEALQTTPMPPRPIFHELVRCNRL